MSKQHLTVFLLKKSVKTFADAIKPGAAAGNPVALANQNFGGALYLPAPVVNPPGWLPFVESGFPGQNLAGNRMASALVLLEAKKRIFALTFGHGRSFLKSEAYVRDFGLRVVVNKVNKDKIRGISLRMFKEMPVKRHEEAAKGTALRTFGVDIQQDLLRAVTGVPEDSGFADRLSGADSLAIDVDLDFGDLADKCEDLLAAYDAKDYAKRGFDWIDNLEVVRTPLTIEQLDNKLVTALKAKDKNVQMLCPDGFSRDTVRGFLYDEEKAVADKHTELELDEWHTAIAGELANLTADKLHERQIRTFDAQGAEVGKTSDHECFVFETELKGIKYVLSNGEWFKVAANFDAQITNYVGGISRKPVALPDFSIGWKGEDQYVAEAAKLPDLMSLHKATCTIGGTKIEPCDLLHRTGALVHVKVWSQSATFSHLLAQGAVSAESLLRYSKFREHVAKSATKHAADIKKLFPKDAFVTSKLDVVMALIRNNSKPLPFFSRLNLMREGQRIERLGYRVNYHRIEVK